MGGGGHGQNTSSWAKTEKRVFLAYSLQGKIKMRNVGQKPKLAQKILKFTKL